MKKIKLNLVGLDGNAFSILGAFQKQARREGWTKEEIDSVLNEAMSSEYNHLIYTIMSHCDIEEEQYWEDDDYSEIYNEDFED